MQVNAQTDIVSFDHCFTGSNVPYDPHNLPQGCTVLPDSQGFIAADADKDGDVDQDDFGVFQRNPTGEGGYCTVSTSWWQNFAIPSQTGTFAAEFDAAPNENAAPDQVGVMGLSSGETRGYQYFAVLVRFNESGNIDARDGDTYSAAAIIPYTAGTTYHFRLVVNVPAHTYSVYVTPQGSIEQTLGADYAFLPEQSTVANLNDCGLFSMPASFHQVCNFKAGSAGPPSLAVSAASLDFRSTAPSLTFDVWNSGGSTLTYSIADNVNWLAVTPVSGSSSGQLVTHTATVNRTGLAQGTYQGTITVTPSTGTALLIAVTMQVPPPVPQDALTPIARWDVVPYQRVNPGSTFNCGVAAFSKNGIAFVRFTISGQGYTGPSPVDVTAMTLNDQTGVYEYWTPINGSNFSSNGPFTVEAAVYGNDGGVRDKTTGGGGVGLDQLPLVANGTGTLAQPQSWVSPTAGNDSTGTVNNSAKPFATIGRAIDAIRLYRSGQGLGNNADGGIVRLMPGSHTCSSGGVSAAIACDSEWVTITTAAGGTRDNTILLPGGVAPTRKICVRGITLSGGGTLGMSATDRSQAMVWVDNCTIIGSGRSVPGAHPLASEYAKLYYTGSSITEVEQATSGSSLCRGLTITRISDDAFQNVPLVVNCVVDDIDPLGTGAHADLFQHGGGSSQNHIDDNVIVYNLKGTHLAYQGIFVNGDPYTVPTKSPGMAFVNVFIQMNSDSHDNCMWFRWVDHLLWWHCTIRRNDSDPRGMQIYTPVVNGVGYPPEISNFSVVGCDFERVIGADTAVIDTTGWSHNHFISTSGGGPVGTDATTGSDSLDSNGVPLAGSPLIARVTPPVVPVDVSNKLRTPSGDIGAFQK